MKKLLICLSVTVGLAALVGSGGGGGGDPGGTPPPPAPPPAGGGGGGTPVAPSITQQPQAVTVPAGASADFTVLAAGTAPLAYQWRRNGVDIAGATQASYTSGALGLADSGAVYSVRVSNAAGSIESAGATVTVNAAPTASFKSGIVGLFAGGYGAGCAGTGAAAGPIEVSVGGEAAWNGGALTAAQIFEASASNNFLAADSESRLDVQALTGAGLGRLSIVLDHASAQHTQAAASDGRAGVLCVPGAVGLTQHKPVAELVASWWSGTSAMLSCQTLTQGTQMLRLDFDGMVLRLGSIQFALNAPHRFDAVSNQPPSNAPPGSGEHARFIASGYTEVSDVQMGRYALSREVFVQIVLPSGEAYVCTGQSDP
jgi:hypothetical protein